jgi:Tfp pilus assembly protein PilZ
VGPSHAGAAGHHIDVELGIHSGSNFYKGLGGNDVIEHGGIFVATYKVPNIGTQVNLRILLPGDFEFQAAAVVQWTREGGGSIEPGFGARFTQITPEGRQLVYRYTRNREPMFYDDL